MAKKKELDLDKAMKGDGRQNALNTLLPGAMAHKSPVAFFGLWTKCSSTADQLLLKASPGKKRNEHTLESFNKNSTASHTAPVRVHSKRRKTRRDISSPKQVLTMDKRRNPRPSHSHGN